GETDLGSGTRGANSNAQLPVGVPGAGPIDLQRRGHLGRGGQLVHLEDIRATGYLYGIGRSGHVAGATGALPDRTVDVERGQPARAGNGNVLASAGLAGRQHQAHAIRSVFYAGGDATYGMPRLDRLPDSLEAG